MKQFFLFAMTLMLTGSILAQSSGKLMLKKGQTIGTQVNVNTDSDLGMGTMKNSMMMGGQLVVTDENDTHYTLSQTMKKCKLEMDGMGQTMSYDSEKDPKDSELGKSVAERLDVPVLYLVDKKTGMMKPLDEKAAGGGGMGMIGAGEGPGSDNTFLVIPADKKPGDSWTTKVTNKGITVSNTYKWVSTEGGIAKLQSEGTMEGTIEQEMNGMTMNVTMSTKSKGEILVNPSTGCVSRFTSDADVNSTIDMMGQQMPVTSKTSNVSVYTY